MGNIVNRVFDSSGPEGKVRGTPQQIIEKYVQLARDATLGNDWVAAENFQQHAEHYTRMLGEAQRELDARREQQEQQQQQQQQGRERQRERERQENTGQPSRDQEHQPQHQPRADVIDPVQRSTSDQPDLIEDAIQSPPQPDLLGETPVAVVSAPVAPVESSAPDSGLVETPESKPKPRARKPRPDKRAEGTPEGATPEAPAKPRRPRTRKPKEPVQSDAPASPDGNAPKAAE